MTRAWLALALAGCNVVYGLDYTRLRGPDRDGDLLEDTLDNCPGTANADQADRDDDGFGDACDFCPNEASAFNGDEDGDRFGDACDVCPVVPDFQYDADRDGIGDVCTFPSPTHLVVFDPFETLEPWVAAGVPWSVTEGTIAPTAALAPDDPGLRRADVRVTRPTWRAELGVVSRRAWSAGDRLGLGLVADDGRVVNAAQLACEPICELRVISEGEIRARFTVDQAPPITRLELALAPTPNMPGRITFTLGIGEARFSFDLTAANPSGAPVVWASPDLDLAFLIIYETE